MKEINEVFILTHIHEFEDTRADIKLIGIYSSKAAARTTITKYKNVQGFRDSPDNFVISKYILNESYPIEECIRFSLWYKKTGDKMKT